MTEIRLKNKIQATFEREKKKTLLGDKCKVEGKQT